MRQSVVLPAQCQWFMPELHQAHRAEQPQYIALAVVRAYFSWVLRLLHKAT